MKDLSENAGGWRPHLKKKPVASAKVPPASDWRTTDEDEINRRRERAMKERHRVRNLDGRHPIFSNFQVDSPSGRRYAVEIRDLAGRQFSCTCTDFRINGLATCKHIEALLLQLPRKNRQAFREAKRTGSDRVDIVPKPGTDRLAVERGLGALSKRLRPLFDGEGVLRPEIDLANALELLNGAEQARIRVSQDVAPWMESHTRVRDRILARREYEMQVAGGLAPESETKASLFPYQREGMLHLAFQERALLADEMGLGKTIQAIAACALLHRLGRARRALIVTPASLKAEWEEQIRRFVELPLQLVFGTRQERLGNYRRKEMPFFTVVNYEQIVPDSLEINAHLQPDIVILDEAQRIKNWATKTAQAVKRLQSRYAFVLTGTPIENRIDELHSIMDFLDPSVLGPLFRFNREFYTFDERGKPEGYQRLEQLRDRVKRLILRRRKVEVETELPSRTDRNLFVKMTKPQRSDYAFHEQKVAKLVQIAKRRPLRPEEQDKLMRELAMMRMVCDTAGILSHQEEDCPKLDEIGRMLEECLSDPEVKVIIFSEWEHMLGRVKGWLEEEKIGFAWHTGSVPQQRRRGEILAFRTDPKCRVFLSTDSGGVGLNLQAASVVINCDLPWNPAKLEQRIARAWRKNQLRPVTVINLVAEESIEHSMLATLASKQELAQGVLDGIGDLSTVQLKRGRDAMLAKLEQVMSPVWASTSGSQQAPPLLALDPAQSFASDARARLGSVLVSCDEAFLEGPKAVLLAVVREGAKSHMPALLAALATTPWRGEKPSIQVMDESTYEMLQQLAKAGVITINSRALRPLLPTEDTAPLSDEERSKAAAYRERARRKARAARALASEELCEEAAPCLGDAVLHLAKAWSVERRWSEPAAVADALSGPFAALWGENHALLVKCLHETAVDPAALKSLSTQLEDKCAA